MSTFTVTRATADHLGLVPEIVAAFENVHENKSTGFASRTPEYITSKILEDKAVIALDGDIFAGFCYIESWGHDRFVANSGLLVKPEYRGQGLARQIKKMAFDLSREKFPEAKIFGLTTGLQVMRINSALGYEPVTFSELTDDPEFWKGCEGCPNFDILQRNQYNSCLCTGMLFDPARKIKKGNGKKVVVAYSGGLDTSYTVMYLSREMGYEVHAVCADTGGFSPEQLAENESKALALGAKVYKTLDVKQEYYDKSLKYMIFGNVLRNGTYPISVSSERIFQALAIARYAREIGAGAIAHGSTGAGNDQVRFDMTFKVLAPEMEIITLTRDMKLSRQQETDYLNRHGFHADFKKLKYSYNVGIWGTSICGGEILDSAQGLPETAYLKKVACQEPSILKIGFEQGEIVSVNGKAYTDKVAAIQAVEAIAAPYGIGRDIHVGDTIIGIKGRVGFEAAAAMTIITAHKYLEKHTLSKWQQYWKDQVANWYGMFLHESQYMEPVMRDIEAMLQSSQRHVSGTVILELRPQSLSTVGVESDNDLVKNKLGEYGEGQKGWTSDEAKGFIALTSVPLKVYYLSHPEEKDAL